MATTRDGDLSGETPAPSPDDVFLIGRLTYGSFALALMGIALLSGVLGHGWLLRAVGGTLAMLSIVGTVLGAVATARPSVLRGLRLGRRPAR